MTKQYGSISAKIPSRPAGRSAVFVVDQKSVIRARGMTDQPLQVPPGRYIVVSATPDGMKWSSDEFADVAAGNLVKVSLSRDPDQETSQPGALRDLMEVASMQPQIRPPASPVDMSIIAASHGDLVPKSVLGDDGVAELFVSHPEQILLEGDWLAAWLNGKPGLHSALTPVDISIAGDYFTAQAAVGVDVVVQCSLDEALHHFAIPLEFSLDDLTASHATEWRIDWLGAPSIQLRFSAPKTNELWRDVSDGIPESVRQTSMQIISDTENENAPLLILLASYVLLRANHDMLPTSIRERLGVALEALWKRAGHLIPDAAFVYAEFLSRESRHQEAFDVLRSAHRAPWFRSGLTYAMERLEFYLKILAAADAQKQLSASKETCERLQVRLRAFRSFAWSIETGSTVCHYRGLPRLRAGGMPMP